MNNNQLVTMCTLFILITMCAQASEYVNNVYTNGSYKKNMLYCKIFNIGDSCKTEAVEAESGTVGDSMTAKRIIIQNSLNVGDSLKCTGLLQCKTFHIGDSCKTEAVEAESGTVGDSMTAKRIIIQNSLNIGDSLNCTGLLQCKTFHIGDKCKVKAVEAEEGTVGNSMTITSKAFFSRKLSVGDSLICNYLVNTGLTVVGDVIRAKNSNFKEVSIKSKSTHNKSYGNISTSGNSTVNIIGNGNNVVYYSGLPISNVTRYFCSTPHNSILEQEDEKSEFENCTIEYILVDKNNNAKQIIELKNNTTVQGDIVFAGNTKGEVLVTGGSHIAGNVINGTIKYQ